jgi:hypothetical protein
VAYREPDGERTREVSLEMQRERAFWLIGEIGRLDGLIGEWSMRVPDGTPAPPEALALMAEKERLETEFRALASALEPAAAPGPSVVRTLLRRLIGRRAK